MRTLHDFVPGDLLRLGPILVARADVLDFQKRFDCGAGLWLPSGESRLAAPVASPLLVQALVFGALVRELKEQGAAPTALPQFDGVRFPVPVRAYDRLKVEVEVAALEVLDGGRGLVRHRVMARNQDLKPVFEGQLSFHVEARPRIQVVERLAGLS
jgi:hypothetical protein